MPVKTVWNDQEIRDVKEGRRYYLRYKRKGSSLEVSIRTQKNGSGLRLASVYVEILGDESIKEAIKKLNRKWRKFYIVNLVPAWEE